MAASASGSQLGPYAAGAERTIWGVGAQKVVPDLDTALRRVWTYAYRASTTGTGTRATRRSSASC
ncbi:MAG TPA: hypothetical protein VH969_02115 [Actinophytocola sp.]|uniref:hypothetical protein n=1 Tax=Actinophytocola sp. TaxID=1872138 RepID=UPI002F9323FE